MKLRLSILFILALIINANCFAEKNLNQPTIIPHYNMQAYDQQINNIYRTILNKKVDDMSERVERITHYFLGKSYLLGATGEGPDAEFDKRPLYRTDTFDCTTFVEMIIALAQSDNLTQFKTTINKVRYKNGDISFVNRNHFVSADWNENNIKNGYIKDITNQFSVPYKIAYAEIDKPAWYKKLPQASLKIFKALPSQQAANLLDKLHANANKVQVVQGHIKYIPYTELYFKANGKLLPNNKVFAQIPSGSIIELVVPNLNLTTAIGTHIDVVHMGFAIRTSHGLMFREASEIERRVVDVPLTQYLQRDYLFTSGKGGISIKTII